MSRWGKVQYSRRRILATLAGTAATGVAGCCNIPVPEIEEPCPDQSLFLAPSEAQSATVIRMAIDTHTHFFNAHDVHVAGYLAHSVGHSAKPWQQELLKFIAPVIGRLSHTMTKSPRVEMEALCQLSNRFVGVAQDDVDRFLLQEIDIHRQRLAQRLYEELSGTRFETLYLEQAKTAQPLGFEPSATRLTKQEILRGLYFGSNSDPATMTERHAGAEEDPGGVFAFVGFMLSDRYHNLMTFKQHFATERDGVSITACMGSLVDFTYWLGCPGEVSAFRDQIMLHEKLAVLTGGFMLPIAPYNPWADIEQDGASLELVSLAIEKHGFVGVKIYPPMGYYPYGNAKYDVETSFKRPDKKELDCRLKALYAYCASVGVPIMAHSRRSMGRDKAHDELASDIGWREVSDLPDAQGLRVNLAHFGSEKNFELSKSFAEMTAQSGAVEFYGDLGYWSDLRTDASAQDEWRKLLADPNYARLLDRMMYGSDWFMIAMEDRWNKYLVELADIFPSLSSDSTAFDRLFFRNAAKCYGLYRSDQPGNRRRLEAYYEQNKIAPPAWMTHLDGGSSSS